MSCDKCPPRRFAGFAKGNTVYLPVYNNFHWIVGEDTIEEIIHTSSPTEGLLSLFVLKNHSMKTFTASEITHDPQEAEKRADALNAKFLTQEKEFGDE